ncbi:uncharacterized protein J3R85_010768 [Psidium guajava]|nr:uncharacterized protein J3R85_010768 [Psidium guajava]
MADLPLDLPSEFDILLEAVFGFSFHGAARSPFNDMIRRSGDMQKIDQANKKSPAIFSMDIPSGWYVEEGDVSGEGIQHDLLVSITTLKLCAKQFHGPHHFLGGRFVPQPIAEKYNLRLPPYPGTSMCVRIGKVPQVDISSMRENYISPKFRKEEVEADPIK